MDSKIALHCLSVNSPDSSFIHLWIFPAAYIPKFAWYSKPVGPHSKVELLLIARHSYWFFCNHFCKRPLPPSHFPGNCSESTCTVLPWKHPCLPARPRIFEGDCCARSVAWSRVASAWLLIIGSIRPLTADQAGLLTRWLKGRSLSDQKL